MSPSDAARILDLPPDATPEQLETHFNELRAKLEDKIAKAPTPGLKAKYRESLDEITAAFETLTIAADASSLPVAKRADARAGLSAVGGRPSASVNSESAPAATGRVASPPAESRKPKARSLEFIFVAVIALAILGGGAWWVMKTRAEKAEAARVAAEQKVEAERHAAAQKAESDRLANEKRLADEAEKLRQEKLTTQLRAQLAEHKITWEALEREERNAERQLAEMKAELRGMRDAPAPRMNEARAMVAAHDEFFVWLRDTLSRHPARVARSKAEEMLAGRQLDDAQAATAELKSHLESLEKEIAAQRSTLLDLEGRLTVEVADAVNWSVVDAFGRRQSGKGPATLDNVAVGAAKIRFELTGWDPRDAEVSISRSKPASASTEYKGFGLKVLSNPAGAMVTTGDGRELGITPLAMHDIPPGRIAVVLRKPGFFDEKTELEFPGKSPEVTVALRARAKFGPKPRWNVPARLRYEHHAESRMDLTGSTGFYATTPPVETDYTAIEEWECSKPDANGQWTEAVRHILQQNVTGSVTSLLQGTVIRYRRDAEGKWLGTFERGKVSEPLAANNLLRGFSPTGLSEGMAAYWPPEDTEVEATWKINPADIPGIGKLEKMTGEASGRLLSVNRVGDGGTAEIEVTYNIQWQLGETMHPLKCTTRMEVDLRDGHIISMETRSESNSTDETPGIGKRVSKHRTHTVTKLTPR